MFKKGDYTNCRTNICEIWIDDEFFCDVVTEYAEIIIDAIKENLLMKGFVDANVRKGDYTNCRYDICEIVDDDGEVLCDVATRDAELIIGVLEENRYFRKVF